MDFTLDKKHEMARSLFREFAENEVKPLAQETDETEQFPAETVKKMAKYGFMGIPVPKEYGGQGCDPLTYVMCVEELSKVCATTGVVVSAHTSGSTIIFLKYLPLPVTRKNSPANPGTSTPIGIHSPGAFRRGRIISTSSGFRR